MRFVAEVASDSTVGARNAGESIRLFMVPGMGYCEGGVGTDAFDAMAPLTAWVERGVASERFDASRVVGGRVVRTRPLWAYPKVALEWVRRHERRSELQLRRQQVTLLIRPHPKGRATR